MKEKTKRKLKELWTPEKRKRERLKNIGAGNPMFGKKRIDISFWNLQNLKNKSWEDRYGKKKASVLKEKARKRFKELIKDGKVGNRGELSGNWKGGISKLPYSFEFNNELKYAIRLRDSFECKICKRKEKNIPFPVHHIDYNKDNNSPENLITLCIKHHSKTNSKRSSWIEYFSRERKIKKEYVSWQEFNNYVMKIKEFLKEKTVTGIIPIIRGGITPGIILSHHLNVPIKNKPELPTDVIVDEIVDFGLTLKTYKRKYPNNLFVCIDLNKKHFKLKFKPDFYVREVDKFIVYPWENKETEGDKE